MRPDAPREDRPAAEPRRREEQEAPDVLLVEEAAVDEVPRVEVAERPRTAAIPRKRPRFSARSGPAAARAESRTSTILPRAAVAAESRKCSKKKR